MEISLGQFDPLRKDSFRVPTMERFADPKRQGKLFPRDPYQPSAGCRPIFFLICRSYYFFLGTKCAAPHFLAQDS